MELEISDFKLELVFIALPNNSTLIFTPKKIILFNLSLYWGGGTPQGSFFHISKTVGARLLKLCDFYC